MTPSKQSETLGFYVLIAAAGKSVRLGSERPKPYLNLGGQAVLRRSLETFRAMPGCRGIQVVINPTDADLFHEAVSGLEDVSFVAGSESRKLSIYNGLKLLSNLKDEDIVLIHDAARPCIQPAEIARLLETMKTAKAATLAVPAADTLCQGGENIETRIDRSGVWQLQTPQAFHYGIIRKAHEMFEDDTEATDDTGLISKMGLEVKLVHGSRGNIKITYPEDIPMAQALLSPSPHASETRIGQGFDVHAFDDDPARKLILAGIEIPGARGLKGHSDADVALHALTDALLGALGEADIGHHFPPSNDAFKNMDSAKFLEKAVDILWTRGGKLINADLTIICESPKIGPYRDAMRVRVAQILQTEETRVNIKATTTEKLGFTGRGEGIVAQAIVSIKLPV